MLNVTLNDGTYIYNKESMNEYLLSLGFDKFDLQDYVDSCFEEELDELANLKKLHREDEITADEYYCHLRDMAQEVSELCDTYANMKGPVTKAKMAQEIMKVVNFYRVD